MIIKPFIKPVFTKFIERDDSFVSGIFNKILSAGYGNYGHTSLIYLRKAAEKYKEEEQDTKAEFNINLIYNMLKQLSAVMNNPNYLNNNYIYYINNVQNNINHYLKALSYIDKNIVLKSKSINDSLLFYGQLSNEIKNYNESFKNSLKNKNIVNHEDTNFLNDSNDFYYSKYNILNKSKVSIVNSNSKFNIINDVLHVSRTKVFNDNNVFNKDHFALNKNIRSLSLSNKKNTLFYVQPSHEIKNYEDIFNKYLYNKSYKNIDNYKNENIANYEEINFLNNNLKSSKVFYYSQDNIWNTMKTSIKNRNSTFNIVNSMLNRSRNEMLNRNLRFNNDNAWNSYNSNFINEEFFYTYDSFNEGILNKILYLNVLNQANINKGFFINRSLGSNNRFDNIILKSLIKKNFNFKNLFYAQLPNEIKNYTESFNNKLYKNSNDYKNENIVKHEYIANHEDVNFLNNSTLKNSNDFYYSQDNIWNTKKTSIKNRNSIFNIINSMRHISRKQMLNRNLMFNTDNAWNSYNSLNGDFLNTYDSFNKEILNKILYLKVLNQASINKGFYIKKSLGSNNRFDNIILKSLIKKNFNFKNLFCAQEFHEISNYADIFGSNLKNLYVNKFNELNQFFDNESSSFQNSQEKIIKLNRDLNNNIFKKQINDITRIFNKYLYNKLYRNIDNYKSENIANYEDVNFLNNSALKTSNVFYYSQDNIRNTKKASIKSRNSIFNIINSMRHISRKQILNRNLRLNTDSAWNSYNYNSINEDFILKNLIEKNFKNSFYGNSIADNNVFNKYHFALNKNISPLSFSNKNNALFYAQLFNEIKNYKESFNNNFKNLYINKFNQFWDNESLIFEGLQEKIITQNWNLKNSIFQRQIYGIARNYNEFHKNSNKIINKNFINYEKVKVLIKSNLQNTGEHYCEQYNKWNTKKTSIINKYFKFHTINSMNKKNKGQILSRSYMLNDYSILHNDKIQSENYFNSIDNTSFLVQKTFVPKYSQINICKDFFPSLSLYNYKKNEFGNGVGSNYIMHNDKKSHTNNNETYEESYRKKVKIKHKRVQTTVSKEDSVAEEIKTEHNTKYVTWENLKRFVNDTVETIIDNKIKSEKRIQPYEDKQIEIISNKILVKIERELKYEKRRRGLI